MKKKIVYLTAAIGIALFNCMPIMAETIINPDNICSKTNSVEIEQQEKRCTFEQGIYTKGYLIDLILSGKIYKSGNGFYIDGIYYTPDYNNLTTIPRIKTKVNDILCDEK